MVAFILEFKNIHYPINDITREISDTINAKKPNKLFRGSMSKKGYLKTSKIALSFLLNIATINTIIIKERKKYKSFLIYLKKVPKNTITRVTKVIKTITFFRGFHLNNSTNSGVI